MWRRCLRPGSGAPNALATCSFTLEGCALFSAAASLTAAIAAMATAAQCGSVWGNQRQPSQLPGALGGTGLFRGPSRWPGASVAMVALVLPRAPGSTRWTSESHQRTVAPATAGKRRVAGAEAVLLAATGTTGNQDIAAPMFEGTEVAAASAGAAHHSARELQALGLLAEMKRLCAGDYYVEPTAVMQGNILPEEVLWDQALGALHDAQQHKTASAAAVSLLSSQRMETEGAGVVKGAEASPDFGWVWRSVQRWQQQCVQCRGISLESCDQHSLCVYTADGIVRLLLGEVLRPTDLMKRSSEEALSEILALPESLQLCSSTTSTCSSPPEQLGSQCCHHTLVNVQCKHHQFVVEWGFDNDNQAEADEEERDEKDMKGAEGVEGVHTAVSSRFQRGCKNGGSGRTGLSLWRGRLRVFQSWSGYFNLAWWMGLEKPLQLHRKYAKFADLRFQKFRDLQLVAGSLSHTDGLQLLRFLLEKGGPVWRIERHELAGCATPDCVASTATGRPLPKVWKATQASWPAALASLMAAAAGQAPPTAALRAALQELVDGGQQERIPQVLDDLSRSDITLGDACGHVLMGALGVAEQAGDWCHALWLLDLLERHAARIDAGLYAAVVGACERGGQLHLAKQLVKNADRHGLDFEMLTHSAVVAACHRGGDFREDLADVYGDAYRFTHNMIKNPELRKFTEEMLSKHNAKADEK